MFKSSRRHERQVDRLRADREHEEREHAAFVARRVEEDRASGIAQDVSQRHLELDQAQRNIEESLTLSTAERMAAVARIDTARREWSKHVALTATPHTASTGDPIAEAETIIARIQTRDNCTYEAASRKFGFEYQRSRRRCSSRCVRKRVRRSTPCPR